MLLIIRCVYFGHLLQVGWAAGDARYGLPANVDALEGWIVTADLYDERQVSKAARAAAPRPKRAAASPKRKAAVAPL
jgi:hypothetical protein